MFKKLSCILLACLMLMTCLSFVGCGDKTNTTGETQTGDAIEVLPGEPNWNVLGSKANPNPETLEGVDKLRVAGYRLFNDDPLNYEFAAGADEFTAKYGIDVEFLVGGGDGMGDDLLAVIATGDPWDLQYAWGISTFPTPMAKGIYTPLTAYVDLVKDADGNYVTDEDGNYQFTDERIDKLVMDGSMWGGEYYGISESQMQEFVAIVYNETWFRELGIETPHDLLAKGEWDLEGYKEIAAQARAKDASFGGNILRPHVVGTYMTEWNGDYPTNTFDSEANTQWLQFWYDLRAGEEYQYGGPGSVYKRESIMTDEVFPNRVKDEFGTLETPIETDDVLRAIYFPNAEGTNTAYITDSHFLVPAGVKEANIPAAVELASAMVNMKGNMVDDLYGTMLVEEDYNLLQETYKGFYYLPRFVNTTIWNQLAGAFIGSVDEKKPVATFIEEYTPVVQSAVDEFIETYGVTPEGDLTKTTEEMLEATQAEKAERDAAAAAAAEAAAAEAAAAEAAAEEVAE